MKSGKIHTLMTSCIETAHTRFIYLFIFSFFIFSFLCVPFFAISFTYTTAQHNIVTDDVVFFKRLLYITITFHAHYSIAYLFGRLLSYKFYLDSLYYVYTLYLLRTSKGQSPLLILNLKV